MTNSVEEAIKMWSQRTDAAGVSDTFATEDEARLPFADLIDYDEIQEMKPWMAMMCQEILMNGLAAGTPLDELYCGIFFSAMAIGCLHERYHNQTDKKGNPHDHRID